MNNPLDNSNWQEIATIAGAIVALITLALTLFIEWPKIKLRLAENPKLNGAVRGAIHGAMLTAICASIGSVAATTILFYLMNTFASIDSSLGTWLTMNRFEQMAYDEAILQATNWVTVGAFIGGFFGAKGEIKTKGVKEGIAGSLIGLILAFFIASLGVVIQVYLDWKNIHNLSLVLMLLISFPIGASVGGVLIGAFSGGVIRQLTNIVYGEEKAQLGH